MTEPQWQEGFSKHWRRWRREIDLDEYEHRWDRLEAEGKSIHGEAAFIQSLCVNSEPTDRCTVLDAGCGMGRVGIELARRGFDVVGVDLDPDLLARAQDRAPDLHWVQADLSTLDLGQRFDIVAFAGNVLGFVDPTRRAVAVNRAAAHLQPGGLLVNGFSVKGGFADAEDWPTAGDYLDWCRAENLHCEATWASWDREPAADFDDYRVFVHRAEQREPNPN